MSLDSFSRFFNLQERSTNASTSCCPVKEKTSLVVRKVSYEILLSLGLWQATFLNENSECILDAFCNASFKARSMNFGVFKTLS